MFTLTAVQVNDDPPCDENTVYAIEQAGYRLFHVYEKDLAESIIRLLNNKETYEKLVHQVIDEVSRQEILETIRSLT
jgi:hypothetical protein